MTVVLFSVVLLGTMVLGIPIAFALLITAGALMWQLSAFDWQLIALQMTSGADSFPLLAVPFFLLAGEAMNAGGLSRRLVELGLSLVGHLRGGLGYVAVITAILLASLSGSAVADTAVLAAMLIPIMRNAGYDVGRSAGLMAAGGIIAPVIPPSIGFIVFGVAGGVSISRLFLAGIVPGVIMGLALACTWWLLTRTSDIAVLPRRTWAEAARSLVNAALALVLPAIIVGGLKAGVFTPTEAAVVAAVYALTRWRAGLPRADMGEALRVLPQHGPHNRGGDVPRGCVDCCRVPDRDRRYPEPDQHDSGSLSPATASC